MKTPSFDADVRQVAEVVASAGIAALLTIGYIVYVGRILGPAEYADFAASLSILYFASLALSPLSPAVARLCARLIARGDRDAVASLRRAAVLRIAGFTGALAIAGAAIAPLAARGLRFRSPAPLFLVLAAIFVFAILNVERGVVQGLLTFRVHNVNTIVEAAGRWVFALLLFPLWHSAGGGMASYLAAMIVAELALAVRFRWNATGVPVDWMEVRRVVAPLAALMLSVAAMQNMDMLVVKRYFAAADSGAYGAATALARGIGIVFVPLYVMAGPILAGSHESRRPIFATTVRFALLFIALAAVPLVLVAIWSRPIVATLYGASFVAAAPLVAPLAGIAIVLYTALMLSQALITVEDHRFLAFYAVMTVVQFVALWWMHASFASIFAVLYAVQALVLAAVCVFLALAWRRSASDRGAEERVNQPLRQA